MTATTLQRLLKYPHTAVFDTAPGAELALRLRHAQGATWSVADEVLTVRAGSGAPQAYDLSAMTVGQLASELMADGFEVTSVSPAFVGLSALVLVEGQGDQGQSNGDHLQAFTSLLWALYTGYAGELRQAKYQVGQALRQMVITQAEGEWLDVWGTLYGDARRSGEADGSYAARIPQEAFRLRVNAYGIEKAILDATGYDVRIEEPWKLIFRLDSSQLSGDHRFYDGSSVGYHLIQPVARATIDWPAVLKLIERNKPAGVIVLHPMVWHGAVVDASVGRALRTGLTRFNSRLVPYEDRALLDFSAYGETSILNHSSRFPLREIKRLSYSRIGSQPWLGVSWGQESWASLNYVVTGGHSRDYRTFYLDLQYRSNSWLPTKTWGTADATWAGLNPVIFSNLTRSVDNGHLTQETSEDLFQEDGFLLLIDTRHVQSEDFGTIISEGGDPFGLE